MNKINRIKELVDVLHKASIAYYRDDNPVMSDKQYDDLYDELGVSGKRNWRDTCRISDAEGSGIYIGGVSESTAQQTDA